MRIASYNVENLFDRAKILNQYDWTQKGAPAASPWQDSKSVLSDYAALSAILAKKTYTPADKRRILELLDSLGLKRANENAYVILRQNRGRLVTRARGRPPEIVADGHDDWLGWLELKREPVNEVATQNTARVIREVNADVLAVVEAEDRIALCRFNELVLGGSVVKGRPYEHVMLIDGNDDRGIDVGILTKRGFPIVSMCSHVDDRGSDGRRIFSRDCAQYEIRVPSGAHVFVLINHFKSKGYGSPAQSNARRAQQAARARAIYEDLKARKVRHIAVVGDLNDTPGSKPLEPLLGNGSDLKDVSLHPEFESDGRPGTFGNGNAANKIDYILLSPALFQRVKRAAAFRKGVWGGKNGTLFPHFDTIRKANEAASDHAAIFADLDI